MLSLVQKISSYFLFGSIFCLFISCSNDEEYNIGVDKTSIVLTDTQSRQELNVFSAGEWGIEAEGLERYLGVPVAQTDWYVIDKVYGNGYTKIVFELKEDVKTEKETVIKVVGNYNTQTVILKYIPDKKQ